MEMRYRKLPHGNELISEIGLGMGSIHESSEEEIEQTINQAMAEGINYFDMAASEGKPYPAYARAFAGRRDQVYLQMHFGAVYDGGKYAWTRDLKRIQTNFENQLRLLNTAYTDMGFLHCIDEMQDGEKVMRPDGLWAWMKQLKQEGVIRHLGLSTHNPQTARMFIETGELDMIMFSINPAYDYSIGTYGIGSLSERQQLYRDCEQAGIGLSVMKPFGGGQLLDAKTSPFGQALRHAQLLQFALDRPAVLTVLPGIRHRQDLEQVLSAYRASKQDKDYTAIAQFTPANAVGVCVYCNHCQPCPMDIHIGLINKYYDLALAGDAMAAGHYDQLTVKADACIRCGHCEAHCPFHVRQMERLARITEYFAQRKEATG